MQLNKIINVYYNKIEIHFDATCVIKYFDKIIVANAAGNNISIQMKSNQ